MNNKEGDYETAQTKLFKLPEVVMMSTIKEQKNERREVLELFFSRSSTGFVPGRKLSRGYRLAT